jgi:hypothetical protein
MNALVLERDPGLAIAPEIADSPETGPGMVFDVMGEGFAIEKDPTPIAQIVAGNVASAEAVMAKIAELSDRMDYDSDSGERFKSLTLADLKAELESIEAADRPVTDTSFVEELIESGSLIRPQAEDKDKVEGRDQEPEKQGRNFMSGLRRSRLARGAATAAVLAAGALAWASSASAGSLQEDCAEDILKTPTILPPTGVYHAGKKRQSFDISLELGSVDPACDDHFERLAYFKPQLVRHGHKINMSPGFVPLFHPGEDGNAPGNVGFSYVRSLADPAYKYWRRGDKAQFKLGLRELNVETGKIVGRSLTTHRMKIATRTK